MRNTRKGEIQDRFWQRVDKNGPNGCWNWTGAVNVASGGYGVIGGKFYGERLVPIGGAILAHRVSWMMANGNMPQSSDYHGWVVMHTCDNRLCVNPAHLMLGTQRANVHDMIAKKRDVRVPGKVGAAHKRAKLTDAQVAEIRASELGTVDLAAKYGVQRSTIQRARYGKSYAVGDAKAELIAGPRVRTGRKGGSNPFAKLTDELVREIRDSKLSAVKWAEKLGMNPESIRMARRRQTFTHIP